MAFGASATGSIRSSRLSDALAFVLMAAIAVPLAIGAAVRPTLLLGGLRRARRDRGLPGPGRPRAPAPDRVCAARRAVPGRRERRPERDEGRGRALLPQLRAERGRHRAPALVRRAARARVRTARDRDAVDARRAVDPGRDRHDDALRELRRPLLRDQPVRRRPQCCIRGSRGCCPRRRPWPERSRPGTSCPGRRSRPASRTATRTTSRSSSPRPCRSRSGCCGSPDGGARSWSR